MLHLPVSQNARVDTYYLPNLKPQKGRKRRTPGPLSILVRPLHFSKKRCPEHKTIATLYREAPRKNLVMCRPAERRGKARAWAHSPEQRPKTYSHTTRRAIATEVRRSSFIANAANGTSPARRKYPHHTRPETKAREAFNRLALQERSTVTAADNCSSETRSVVSRLDVDSAVPHWRAQCWALNTKPIEIFGQSANLTIAVSVTGPFWAPRCFAPRAGR